MELDELPSTDRSELPRTRSPSTLSRKRARLDDADLDEVIQELQPHGSLDVEPVRDDTYYMADGSCVLRVENTLFNVHRTILSKDSSSFSAMFELPVPRDGQDEPEGSSDDNAVVLTGDTVSQFRNFLWALYSLPHELMAVYSPDADVTQLMDIAHVANKYSFRSLETWALDALHEYVTRKPTPLLCYPPRAGPRDLATSGQHITRLAHLAQTCAHARLLGALVLLLKQRMSVQLQYAFLAMSLADDLGLRALRGVAYMEVLQRGMKLVMDGRRPAGWRNNENIDPNVPFGTPGTGDVDLESDEEDEGVQETPTVSQAQLLRLLSGYHRLTQTWEELRLRPLQFDHAPTCGATWHQHGCTQSWLEFWKEKSKSESVLLLGPADVQGRLRAMAKEFDRWGSATYMHHDCRMTAKRVIQEKIKELDDTLPDFFSDWGS